MTLSLEDFITYYEKNHRFPDGSYVNSEKTLNRNQLESKYRKYVASQGRKTDKSLRDREKVRSAKPKPRSDYTKSVDSAIAEAKKLDPEGRVWLQNLSSEEIGFVASQISGNPILQILDGAHIISRVRCKTLSNDVCNILVLPRYVHANIDNYRNPLLPGCPRVDVEGRDELWKRIVGEERWEELVERMREFNER